MYVNVIWPLLTAAVTYLIVQDIQYAYQAAFIFILVFALIKLTPIVFNSRTYKTAATESSDSDVKKRQAKAFFAVSTYVALIFLVGLVFFSNFTYFNAHFSAYKLAQAAKGVPNKTLIDAIHRLKKHPNDMRYCAPLFFPSLKNNNPKAIATYLAYYHLSPKYCDQFWQWGRENCGYLEGFDYGMHPTLALKNIKLCKIANSPQFLNRIESIGEVNANGS